MIYDTDKWQIAVTKYVGLASLAFKTWDRDMDKIAGELGLGGDLGDLEDAVGDVKKETENLNIEFDKTITLVQD
jgi:hypothetical protein